MNAPVRLVTFNTPMLVNPHYADTYDLDGEHCPVCCELAFDAWERMTTGGAQVQYIDPLKREPWGIHRFRDPLSRVYVTR